MQSLLYLSAAEKMANRTFVLATYRHLLRATRIAFRGISASARLALCAVALALCAVALTLPH